MLGRQDAIDCFADFAADGGVLRGQVELRNRVRTCGERICAHAESVAQNRAWLRGPVIRDAAVHAPLRDGV